MIKSVDINCDMGEVLISSGKNQDHLLMPYISSCNIATGSHAGDLETMVKLMYQAKLHNVAIGIHPSYVDRKNFGRTSLKLEADAFYGMMARQFEIFYTVADKLKFDVSHCKPHGALYHDLSSDPTKGELFISIIKSLGRELTVYAMSGSDFSKQLKSHNIPFKNEVFSDRKYESHSKLVSRTNDSAVIDNEEELISQVQHLINKTVKTNSGEVLSVDVDTICIHSDTKNAVELSKAMHSFISSKEIIIGHN